MVHPARLRYFYGRLKNPFGLERLVDDAGTTRSVYPSRSSRLTGRHESTSGHCGLPPPRGRGRAENGASVVGRLAGTTNPIVQRDLVATLLRSSCLFG